MNEANEVHDIFLRAHTVVLAKPQNDAEEQPQKKPGAFRGKKKSVCRPTPKPGSRPNAASASLVSDSRRAKQ